MVTRRGQVEVFSGNEFKLVHARSSEAKVYSVGGKGKITKVMPFEIMA